MIKSLKRFDSMTLYEMRERFEEGSANWIRLDKSIKFRAKLGLDHMTNNEYLAYCKHNRELIKKKIKAAFGKDLDSRNYINYESTLLW